MQRIKGLLAGMIVAAVGSLASSTMAEVLFVDEFNYPSGDLTITDGSGANVSAGLWAPHSGTEYSQNIQVINENADDSGYITLINPGRQDAHRPTGLVMGPGDKWYYLAVFSVEVGSGPDIKNEYFAHFKDAAFGYRGRAYVDNPNTGTNGFTVGLSATSGGQTAKWAKDLNFGQTYRLIIAYTYDTGEVELWIDPTDESSPSITDTGGAETSIDAMSFRQAHFSTGEGEAHKIRVEAVAVGTSFDDVNGAIP